ncbi:Uncharacterized protein dnl_53290 [Desulfonema limicola]|uniref:Uncharacterized protein n=1 Tax=Desulfonema limicola TaxID=45656 RepID=A0A975BCI1_9BACT|nr:Uncharacterized protein dnl_53290 [Desulfonema limicola]
MIFPIKCLSHLGRSSGKNPSVSGKINFIRKVLTIVNYFL